MLDANDASEGDEEIFNFEGNESLSIFEHDPFKEFTERKFKELLRQENMEKLIKMREQVLDYRHKKQMDRLNQELQNNRVSPKSFQSKRNELEKWINKEKEQIQISKKALQKGWSHFNDTIKRVTAITSFH